MLHSGSREVAKSGKVGVVGSCNPFRREYREAQNQEGKQSEGGKVTLTGCRCCGRLFNFREFRLLFVPIFPCLGFWIRWVLYHGCPIEKGEGGGGSSGCGSRVERD